jgi:hypothetical protein
LISPVTDFITTVDERQAADIPGLHMGRYELKALDGIIGVL